MVAPIENCDVFTVLIALELCVDGRSGLDLCVWLLGSKNVLSSTNGCDDIIVAMRDDVNTSVMPSDDNVDQIDVTSYAAFDEEDVAEGLPYDEDDAEMDDRESPSSDEGIEG